MEYVRAIMAVYMLAKIKESEMTTLSNKMVNLSFHDYSKTWNEAHEICKTQGGSLYKEDSAERVKVLQKYRQRLQFHDDVWIGLYYPSFGTNDIFVWTNCVSLNGTYTRYKSGEPGNTIDKKCAFSKENDGWISTYCSGKKKFVCETPGADCMFDKTEVHLPSNSSSFIAKRIVTANGTLCKKECMTKIDNDMNCWGFKFHTPDNCTLYFTTNPFLFKPGMSTFMSIKVCYSFGSKIFLHSSSYGNKDDRPVENCTSYLNSVETKTETTTTTNTWPSTMTATEPPATTLAPPTITPAPPTSTTALPTTTTSATSAPSTQTTTATPVTSAPSTQTTTATPVTSASSTRTTNTTPATSALTSTTTTTPATSAPSTTTTTPSTSAPSTRTTTMTPATSAPSTQTTTATPATSAPSTQTTTATPAASAPSTQTTTATPATSAPSITTTTTPATSAPSTTTTSAITTSTSANINSTSCGCQCSDLSNLLGNYTAYPDWKNLTVAEKVEFLVTNLRVDKRNLSSYIRKKTSARDDRRVSVAAGYLAISVLSTIFGLIVVSDVMNFLKFLTKTKKHSSNNVSEPGVEESTL